MPSEFATLDTSFPNLEGKTTEEKLQSMTDYLYQLLEQLRYTLHNLGVENFNPVDLQNITEPIYADIKDTADGLETQIIANAEGLATKVSKDGVISSINQSAEAISINASKVNLSGYVTFTNLSTNGQTTINGGNITTGEINAVNIRGISIYGASFWDTNGRLRIRMLPYGTGGGVLMMGEQDEFAVRYVPGDGTRETTVFINGMSFLSNSQTALNLDLRNDIVEVEQNPLFKWSVLLREEYGYGSTLPTFSTAAERAANTGRVFFLI